MDKTGLLTARPAGARSARAWVAVVLAWVAGFVDVTGYLTLIRVFTSHMSGNSVAMVAYLAQHQWAEAARRAFPIPLFILGIFMGAILGIALARKGYHARLSLTLLIEAGLLLAFMIYGSRVSHAGAVHEIPVWKTYLLTALLAMAMGVQSSALRHVWGRSVHTAYVTGMLTHFTEDAAVLAFRGFDRLKGGRAGGKSTSNHPKRLRTMLLYGGIWVAFVLGALCGGFGKQLWGWLALVAPLSVLAVVIFYDLLRPIHASAPLDSQGPT